ncbi:MAG: hypothetical protein CVV49_18620 [Spirochaetae bacterium HGW-Spirochaetae-5]|nr:MAG: hypothetical protein CVV49_18620 [Spirochaetae bacterium HGW-Spirochaetae-5]
MMDPTVLLDLVTTEMPYGKYKGVKLCNLPEYYVVWYHENGFPSGRLGMLLSTLYEIKIYGLEYLLNPIKKRYDALL